MEGHGAMEGQGEWRGQKSGDAIESAYSGVEQGPRPGHPWAETRGGRETGGPRARRVLRERAGLEPRVLWYIPCAGGE